MFNLSLTDISNFLRDFHKIAEEIQRFNDILEEKLNDVLEVWRDTNIVVGRLTKSPVHYKKKNEGKN